MADRDRVDKVVMEVPPGYSEEFYAAAEAAGWSDDPGTGKSIYIKDREHPEYGKEIPNPQPMAPPVGYVADDTLEDMVRRHMQKQFNLASIGPIEETEEEAEDFEIDDELPDLRSIYEVHEMETQYPGIGKPPGGDPPAAEPAKPVEEKGA